MWTSLALPKCSCPGVQLAHVREQLGNASAKAALFEERYKEERALRREVCPCME